MSTIETNNNSNNNGNNAPLTKSQKKRMKRNKAKSKKAEANKNNNKDSSNNSNSKTTTPELDPLNSHDALRIGLQEMGFKLPAIDKSIEDMWNLSLDYSDINSVMVFMTAEQSKTQTQASSDGAADDATDGNGDVPTSTSASEKDVPLRQRNASEEELKTVSTASFSVKEPTPSPAVPLTVTKKEQPVPQQQQQQKQQQQKQQDQPETQAEKVETRTATSNGNANTAVKKAAVPKSPPTLKTKLDIVANDENLTDAIVALTEWIVKAATPIEVKELCDGPCALRTVIRRVIITPGPKNYSAQLLDLIGSILRIAGIPATELSSFSRALMHTLTKAKSVINDGTTGNSSSSSSSNNNTMSDNVADFVTETVTSHISMSVDKISTASAGSGVSFDRLDAEIASLKSSISSRNSNETGGGGGVGGLVVRRDQLKNLAEKHSNILNIKLRSIPMDGKFTTMNGNGIGHSNGSIETSTEEMMAKVFGSKFEEVLSSKAKYEELSKRQMESHTSLTDRQEIVSNINNFKTKKGQLSNKIKELELELKRLVAEEDSIDDEIVKAEGKLVILDDSLSVEAKEIEKQLGEVSQNMKLSESISDVVASLQGFQSEVNKVTTAELSSLQAKIPQVDLKSDLPPRMNHYLASMSEYFNSEYKLVSFLQRRAQLLRDGFPRLEMEIEECKGLGMTSNVVEMEKKLNQMQQNIADDDNIIKVLQREAEEMKRNLAMLFKEYKSTGAESGSFEASLKNMEMTINAIV